MPVGVFSFAKTLAAIAFERRRNETRPLGILSDEGFAMPIWMEILLNVIGYAGFVAIATMNPCADEAAVRQAQRDPVLNPTE